MQTEISHQTNVRRDRDIVFFWQIAFEFNSALRVDYDVIVEAKLYFNYLRVDEAFYTLRSEDAPYCPMEETCHRR